MAEWVAIADRLPDKGGGMVLLSDGATFMLAWLLDYEIKGEPVWQIVGGMRRFWPATHWAYVDLPRSS